MLSPTPSLLRVGIILFASADKEQPSVVSANAIAEPLATASPVSFLLVNLIDLHFKELDK